MEEPLFVDYDTQWKLIITDLFEDFILFFLKEAHSIIDWDKTTTFLEQELYKILPDEHKKGKKINDKLVKVHLKGGEEQWILIHIEVQGHFEVNFVERMFDYFYRIKDRYQRKIAAIAIYIGEKTPPIFDQYNYNFLGTSLSYKFNTYRIIDIPEEKLLESSNPFALAVLASQYVLSTKKDWHKRYFFKMKLIRLAFERNYSRQKIVSLFRFIYFIIKLPLELDTQFRNELKMSDMHTSIDSIDEETIRAADLISSLLTGIEFTAILNDQVEKKVKEQVEKKVKEQVEKKVKEQVEEQLNRKIDEEKKEIVMRFIKDRKYNLQEIADIVNLPIKTIQALTKD